jgi:hypothetical protein
MLHSDCLYIINQYQLLDDVNDHKLVSRDFYRTNNEYVNVFWKSKYKQYCGKDIKMDYKLACLAEFQKIIPEIVVRTQCDVLFKLDENIFNKFNDNMLRVITMHTLILASTNSNSKVFIVDHNNSSGVIKYVDINKILMYMFYGVDCCSSYYVLDNRNKINPLRQNFDSNVSNKIDYTKTTYDIIPPTYIKKKYYRNNHLGDDLNYGDGQHDEIRSNSLTKTIYNERMIFNCNDFQFEFDKINPNKIMASFTKLNSFNHADCRASCNIGVQDIDKDDNLMISHMYDIDPETGYLDDNSDVIFDGENYIKTSLISTWFDPNVNRNPEIYEHIKIKDKEKVAKLFTIDKKTENLIGSIDKIKIKILGRKTMYIDGYDYDNQQHFHRIHNGKVVVSRQNLNDEHKYNNYEKLYTYDGTGVLHDVVHNDTVIYDIPYLDDDDKGEFYVKTKYNFIGLL